MTANKVVPLRTVEDIVRDRQEAFCAHLASKITPESNIALPRNQGAAQAALRVESMKALRERKEQEG